MKGTNETPAGKRAVALGRLEELASFKTTFKQAAGLPGEIPVLTFPLRLSEFQCLSATSGPGNFGFGHVELDDGMLMTMRLQLGAVQFYWLAEMTDPELWAAIDMWRRFQRVPVCLKIEKSKILWDYAFVTWDVKLDAMKDEKYRYAPRRVVTPHDWHAIAGLTDIVRDRATTDIPGVPLQHAFASALLTKQFEEVSQQETKVKKLVVVKGVNGALVLM